MPPLETAAEKNLKHIREALDALLKVVPHGRLMTSVDQLPAIRSVLMLINQLETGIESDKTSGQ